MPESLTDQPHDSPSPALEDFERVVFDELVPEFCADEKRQCNPSSFKKESVKVHETDARDFVRAWKGGLLSHQGRGLYRASRNAASEQFFWTGAKQPTPRSFTLWIEPVITVGALARLHWDYGWPKELIGTQSVDWAFDLVTFQPGAGNEHIAGEVKKSVMEIERLLLFMRQFGQNPDLEVPAAGPARNAYMKVAALRARHAPLFWAVGPAGLSKVFRVHYGSLDTVELIPTDERELHFA